MKEQTKNIDLRLVGKESLVYSPSKVSWSISQHISRENPLFERVIVYAMLYMLAVIVAYAAISRVAISTNATGVLEFESPSSQVLVQNDFTVEEVYVSQDEEVIKGQVVMRGEGQLSQATLDTLAQSRVRITELIHQDEKGSNCGVKCVRELRALSGKTFAFERDVTNQGVFKDYLVRLTSEFKNYINALQNKQSLRASTAGLRLQIDQTREKIEKIERQKSVKILQMEYNQLRTELANLTSQLNERRSSVRSSVRQASNAFTLSLSQLPLQTQEYTKSNQVLAPMNGVIVFDKKLAPGQFLPARTSVFQVIPVSDFLVGKTLVGNKDISKIEEGHRVKISLDAMPEREYSSVWGHVKSIAIDPKEDQQTKEIKYEVLIALDQQSLEGSRGEDKFFRLGMTYQAQIITEYRSLFKVALMKLLNIKDKYIGDYL